MKLRVNVNGKVYEVDVEVLDDGTQNTLAQYGQPRVSMPAVAPSRVEVDKVSSQASSTAASSENDNVFRSPISGVVVRVSAEVGQSVQTDDELMVLEAMKMETVLKSHCAGTVAKINANVGDSVQVQQPLIEFE